MDKNRINTKMVVIGKNVAAICFCSYSFSPKGAAKAETTTVGRWMSKVEYDTMVKTGKVPESFTGTTHVANPATP